ncbi:carotenoid biosynthesis protein [Anaerocolumna sp. MB42-C2]|uniref:carotenoid biosynthesis protein n=1 Tax=Anaerocolumna sp. MB42-C2 TaxID=3070997 RepID=UPI0027E1E3E3|nr:carotenoid biosynthesis protein [Anaerocolumna sp. MB42-C2]WMJ86021.1 carotenoid biosynthesis protein [Anaerocolumna sp. MB42-C2]
MIRKQYNKIIIIRWVIIIVLFLFCISKLLFPNSSFTGLYGPIAAISICILACLHGTDRYGFKNLAIFFLITWLISNFFEALSIYMGFPFGNYHYTMPGIRILDVPLIIMPAYFGMGYMSWTLSNILTGQNGKKLKGTHIFLVPFVATFIMVMWDVVMDPVMATINKEWIWEDGGTYLGIPISNYLGWFFVVYVFLQLFAVFIAKFDIKGNDTQFNKAFWLEAAMLYGIQAMNFVGYAIVNTNNIEIYRSTGLISIFTMMFVSILSIITIFNSNPKGDKL